MPVISYSLNTTVCSPRAKITNDVAVAVVVLPIMLLEKSLKVVDDPFAHAPTGQQTVGEKKDTKFRQRFLSRVAAAILVDLSNDLRRGNKLYDSLTACNSARCTA